MCEILSDCVLHSVNVYISGKTNVVLKVRLGRKISFFLALILRYTSNVFIRTFEISLNGHDFKWSSIYRTLMGKSCFSNGYASRHVRCTVAYRNLTNRMIINDFRGTFKLLNKRPRTRKKSYRSPRVRSERAAGYG